MKYLFVLMFLFPLFAFSNTSQADKDAAFDNMNESIDSFDEQTDEEALQELKNKIREKKRKKEEEKKKDEKKDENSAAEEGNDSLGNHDGGLKDSKVNESNRYTYGEGDQYGKTELEKSNPEGFADDDNDNGKSYSDRGFLNMFGIGGGYRLANSEYEASRHFELEIGSYAKGHYFYKTGAVLSLSFIRFDRRDHAFINLGFSSMITPVHPDFGPFLRIDAGFMGDFYYEELHEVGVFTKGGAGFLATNGQTGFSVQLLYVLHLTSAGINNGVELEVAYHF